MSLKLVQAILNIENSQRLHTEALPLTSLLRYLPGVTAVVPLRLRLEIGDWMLPLGQDPRG